MLQLMRDGIHRDGMIRHTQISIVAKISSNQWNSAECVKVIRMIASDGLCSMETINHRVLATCSIMIEAMQYLQAGKESKLKV